MPGPGQARCKGGAARATQGRRRLQVAPALERYAPAAGPGASRDTCSSGRADCAARKGVPKRPKVRLTCCGERFLSFKCQAHREDATARGRRKDMLARGGDGPAFGKGEIACESRLQRLGSLFANFVEGKPVQVCGHARQSSESGERKARRYALYSSNTSSSP